MKTMHHLGVFAVLLVCLFSALVSAAAAETLYIGGAPDTFLRSDESTTKPYLARMPYGAEVELVWEDEVDGDMWSFINYNGQCGYCKSKYLRADDPYEGVSPQPGSWEEAFGGNLLQKGNKTPDYRVVNLQLCLIEGGYLDADPGADGYFGSDTYKALKRFQKANNLEQVGRAGKTTKSVLWHLYKEYLMECGVMR